MKTPIVYVTACPEHNTYLAHCPELGVIREMFVSTPDRAAAEGQRLVLTRTEALLKLLRQSSDA